MADTGAVLEKLATDADILNMSSLRLPVLVPNQKGLESALNALQNHRGIKGEISVFTAASDAFSLKNTNCTVEESLKKLVEICETAKREDLPIRGYVSTVIGCPYSGEVDPQKVKDVTVELLKLGCYEVSLGDTIGVGTAGSVRKLLQELLRAVDPSKLAVHFHDTYGQALTNTMVALEVQHSIFSISYTLL
jgi:hydroxymethylglutaryl-CoA lyase